MNTENNTIIEKSKEYVNELLVPLENHYYHHYNHALDVMQRAVYLGEKEGLGEEELEMLALAGLFHDTGFVIQYEANEEIGAKIARNFLKTYLYPEEKIKIIENIILATIVERKPNNIYEEIIKDADLDNLGRNDFFQKGEKLKRELETIKNIKILEPEWNHGSISLLKKHRFYTKTQKEEREIKKQENKKALENLIKGKKEEEKIKVYQYV